MLFTLFKMTNKLILKNELKIGKSWQKVKLLDVDLFKNIYARTKTYGLNILNLIGNNFL